MDKTIGVYLWPNMTMLDVLGPHQFLGFVPGFTVVTFAKTRDPVVTDTGIRMIPDHDFSTCPSLDILLVGGGGNPLPQMQDENVISFLRETGNSADYVTSVCTRALILAEAGLLDATRWQRGCPSSSPPRLADAHQQERTSSAQRWSRGPPMSQVSGFR